MTVSLWRASALANTTTNGSQDRAQIAALADGGYALTWRDAADNGNIKARIFNADGSARTGEIDVPDSPAGTQTDPTVAALSGGGFLIAWSEGTGTAAKAFTAAGAPTGAQTLVANAARASAASFGDGAVVGYDSIFSDIGYELFGAQGQRLGGTTTANNTVFNEQDDAALTALSGGRFLLSWQTDGLEIRARILTAAGPAQAASDFKVNTTSGLYGPGAPSTATLSGGGFVVTWLSESGSGDVDVRARVFGADGQPTGADFPVNTRTAGSQYNAETVGLKDGGFLVLWYDQATRSIEGQRYGASGAAVDGQFTAARGFASANEARNLSASLLDDGRVAVVFRGLNSASGDGDQGVYSLILDPRDGRITGDADADLLYGGDGADVIVGDGGDDVMYAGAGDDQAYGGTGRDTIYGGAGADFLRGMDGDDVIYGEAGANVLWGEGGDDVLVGGDGAETFDGGGENDQIYAGGGADTLLGGDGDDFLRGMDGNDVIYGDAGNNTLWGEGGDDVLLGGGDAEVLLGGTGSDEIRGGGGADQVYAGEDADRVWGDGGNDFLRGMDGNDQIRGGEGADVLIGDAGGDLLWGDAGADRFVYLAQSDSTVAAADQLIDFQSGVDKIDFTAVTAGRSVSWALLPAGGGYTALDVDFGSDGVVDMRLVLSPGATVTAGDLLF